MKKPPRHAARPFISKGHMTQGTSTGSDIVVTSQCPLWCFVTLPWQCGSRRILRMHQWHVDTRIAKIGQGNGRKPCPDFMVQSHDATYKDKFQDNYSIFNEFTPIGGSRGCARHTPLPTGPNSFVFANIFSEKRLRRRSTPPLTGARPLRESLDPPLTPKLSVSSNKKMARGSVVKALT